MPTEKTPAHKRVARAEKAKDDWKVKAIERREEAEKWKSAANRKSSRISELEEQKAELEHKLEAERRNNENLKGELEDTKKKYP